MLLTFIKYVLFDLLAQSSRPEVRTDRWSIKIETSDQVRKRLIHSVWTERGRLA